MRNIKQFLVTFTSAFLTFVSVTTLTSCNKSKFLKASIQYPFINNVDIPINPGKNYKELNDNKFLNQYIADIISVDVTPVIPFEDFYLSNNKNYNMKQSVGDKVTITVISIGNKIKDNIAFDANIVKIDISNTLNNSHTLEKKEFTVENGISYKELTSNIEIIHYITDLINNTNLVAIAYNKDLMITTLKDNNEKINSTTNVDFIVKGHGDLFEGMFNISLIIKVNN